MWEGCLYTSKKLLCLKRKKKQILQDQFKLMTKRCMYIITWPSLALTTIFGLYMLHENQTLICVDWMKVKLIFVTILIVYTAYCQKILNTIIKLNAISMSDFKLRLFNEFATLLLISLISLAILKTSLSWLKAIIVFVTVAITLLFLIRLYKKYNN
mgnify:CR=1 FL=1